MCGRCAGHSTHSSAQSPSVVHVQTPHSSFSFLIRAEMYGVGAGCSTAMLPHTTTHVVVKLPLFPGFISIQPIHRHSSSSTHSSGAHQTEHFHVRHFWSSTRTRLTSWTLWLTQFPHQTLRHDLSCATRLRSFYSYTIVTLITYRFRSLDSISITFEIVIRNRIMRELLAAAFVFTFVIGKFLMSFVFD